MNFVQLINENSHISKLRNMIPMKYPRRIFKNNLRVKVNPKEISDIVFKLAKDEQVSQIIWCLNNFEYKKIDYKLIEDGFGKEIAGYVKTIEEFYEKNKTIKSVDALFNKVKKFNEKVIEALMLDLYTMYYLFSSLEDKKFEEIQELFQNLLQKILDKLPLKTTVQRRIKKNIIEDSEKREENLNESYNLLNERFGRRGDDYRDTKEKIIDALTPKYLKGAWSGFKEYLTFFKNLKPALIKAISDSSDSNRVASSLKFINSFLGNKDETGEFKIEEKKVSEELEKTDEFIESIENALVKDDLNTIYENIGILQKEYPEIYQSFLESLLALFKEQNSFNKLEKKKKQILIRTTFVTLSSSGDKKITNEIFEYIDKIDGEEIFGDNEIFTDSEIKDFNLEPIFAEYEEVETDSPSEKDDFIKEYKKISKKDKETIINFFKNSTSKQDMKKRLVEFEEEDKNFYTLSSFILGFFENGVKEKYNKINANENEEFEEDIFLTLMNVLEVYVEEFKPKYNNSNEQKIYDILKGYNNEIDKIFDSKSGLVEEGLISDLTELESNFDSALDMKTRSEEEGTLENKLVSIFEDNKTKKEFMEDLKDFFGELLVLDEDEMEKQISSMIEEDEGEEFETYLMAVDFLSSGFIKVTGEEKKFFKELKNHFKIYYKKMESNKNLKNFKDSRYGRRGYYNSRNNIQDYEYYIDKKFKNNVNEKNAILFFEEFFEKEESLEGFIRHIESYTESKLHREKNSEISKRYIKFLIEIFGEIYKIKDYKEFLDKKENEKIKKVLMDFEKRSKNIFGKGEDKNEK